MYAYLQDLLYKENNNLESSLIPSFFAELSKHPNEDFAKHTWPLRQEIHH